MRAAYRWCPVVVHATAMAWVESAMVLGRQIWLRQQARFGRLLTS